MQRCYLSRFESRLQTPRLCLDVRPASKHFVNQSLTNTRYGVDEEVGAAIRESGIPRSEIFITSKFWPHFAAPENVELCLDQVLKNMGLDYVDLFLAHVSS